MSTRPRPTAPLRTFPETFVIIDNKYGRPGGTYTSLAQAKQARGTNRRRYQIDTLPEPCFRAGRCSGCGWTSRVHLVKTAAADNSRQHRATHHAVPPGTCS